MHAPYPSSRRSDAPADGYIGGKAPKGPEPRQEWPGRESVGCGRRSTGGKVRGGGIDE